MQSLSVRRHPSDFTTRLIATIMAIGLLLVPTTAVASTGDPAQAAAGWLAEELVDGERLVGSWTDSEGRVNEFDDHGGTADVVFALSAAQVAAPQIRTATDWLIAEAGMYTGEAFGALSAGATAKLALALMTDGRDPRSVGGDLIAALQDLEVTEGADAGRFSDAGDDDWSSTISQALAILALERAEGVSASSESIAYLADQQCTDGGFPFSFSPGECVDATAIDGPTAIDATLIVIQALIATGHDVAEALAWLDARFADDGWGNANTAGLAAVAYGLSGRAGDADQARDFILELQDGCDGDATGAIAYNAAGEGDPVFATRQAILGLTGQGYLTVTSQGASQSAPRLDCSASNPTVIIVAAVGLGLLAVGIVVLVARRRKAAA
ncbi:MAG: hypothetical protein WD358_07705 [Nitriliruptoraceae bacterium]